MRSELTTSHPAVLPHGHNQDLRVVLNGGGHQMESATIPMQWYVSERVAQKGPTHILVVDRGEGEITARSRDTGIFRHRYICSISDRVMFLQLFSSGRHNITVHVLDLGNEPELQRRRIDALLRRELEGYQIAVPVDSHQVQGLFGYPHESWLTIVATSVLEIEVPAELFAHKPQSRLGGYFWKWVNLTHSEPPRDECKYRARMMWAFTGQIVLVALYLAVHLVCAVSCTLYSTIGRAMVLFFGYRPSSLLIPLRIYWTTRLMSWSDNRERHWTEYNLWTMGTRKSYYRIWAWNGSGNYTYMPITGVEIVVYGLIASVIFVIIKPIVYVAREVVIPWSSIGVWSCWIAAILIACDFGWRYAKNKPWMIAFVRFLGGGKVSITERLASFIQWVSFRWNQYRSTRRYEKSKHRMQIVEEKRRIAEETAAEELTVAERAKLQRIEWMKTELSVGKAPSRVDLGHLPKPLKADVGTTVKIAFWATKAKVCKPFSTSRK